MAAQLIDGAAEAAKLATGLRSEIDRLAKLNGSPPALAVVLVGNDASSAVYVRNKTKMADEIGIASRLIHLDHNVTMRELLHCIAGLNSDPAIDGILVQLPLPAHLNASDAIAAIDPRKDVDGIHPFNVGEFYTGASGMRPCTPQGCMKLINSVARDITGMEAVVIGRSNIVGKPMAHMLNAANATVTMAHSATQDLSSLCRRADILVSAVGHPEFVRRGWVKPGAIVIDVGINQVTTGKPGRSRIVGDVAFDEVSDVASAITPVPGGVGPMTIACLMRNTVNAAATRRQEFTPQVDWIMDF